MPALAPMPLVTRVRLTGYRSIAGCDVQLQPLTVIVGDNAAGKSNFVDALRLVSDSLRGSLGQALADRGGIAEVCHAGSDHLGIRLDLRLDGAPGMLAFELAEQAGGGFAIHREACSWAGRGYEIVRGELIAQMQLSPPASPAPDQLYLTGAAELRPVADALSAMSFYNVSPERIRAASAAATASTAAAATGAPPARLARDAANLVGVLDQLAVTRPSSLLRIEHQLTRLVPGAAPVATLRRLHQLSDGSLRALAITTALYSPSATLVGLEEPEAALHPAATGLLLDLLREAARERQLVIITHSADLIGGHGLPGEQLIVAKRIVDRTAIGPLDPTSRRALRDSPYGAGELLRQGQLEPDLAARSQAAQIELFAPS